MVVLRIVVLSAVPDLLLTKLYRLRVVGVLGLVIEGSVVPVVIRVRASDSCVKRSSAYIGSAPSSP